MAFINFKNFYKIQAFKNQGEVLQSSTNLFHAK